MRDLSGLPVGMLTVSAPVGRTRDGHIVWECHCSCGKSKNIASQSLTRKIPVQSCGCLNHRRAQDKRRPEGPWNEGKSYLIKNGEHCYRTRGGWSKAALKHYGNRCEICGWDKARCDVHHRKPKSKGGLHTIRNAIVLCPNCHRVTHEAEGTPCDT
jgi:predicted HNH restriction endonuclease